MNDPRLLLPTATSQETRRALAALFRPQRLLTLLALAVFFAATSLGLAGPAVLGYIVDTALAGDSVNAITLPVVILVVATVAQGLLTALGNILVAQVGETALARLREQVVSRALLLPLDQIERAGSGDLLARISGDVAVITTAVRSVLPALASAALTILLTLASLAVLDWRFALAGLAAAPIQLYTLVWYLRTSGPVFAAERIAEGDQAQELLDALGGAATVRALGLSERQTAAVTTSSLAAMGYALRAVALRTRFFGRLNLAEFAGLSSILVVGFFLVRSGSVTVGATTAAALYFHRLFDPINILLGLFDQAQMAAAGLTRLVGIARVPQEPAPRHPGRPADASISIRNLRFAYTPELDVLQELNLEVGDGEKVAVVGASGAGKTSLAKLVAGIHQPTDGEIRLGDVPLAELDPVTAKQQIALVTQEVYVFAGSLADDLRLVRPLAGENDLREALGRVGALPWVLALPDALDTIVGEGALPLTATQAQQLALARLVLKDPAVAVLDEATAEAGSAGARILEAAAANALKGRTGIVVAHRLSQAATADRIVVMDAGRISEVGEHDELIAAEGQYASLWSAWSVHRSDS